MWSSTKWTVNAIVQHNKDLLASVLLGQLHRGKCSGGKFSETGMEYLEKIFPSL